ncbi:hypothetical protein HON36_02805 [Candidatus Parcubacteria bacterium]|nr:hypothetical protein [Candidatus Parcubacteria bacterium]MBT7228552.1 hypothetical protein [Candidatus Parcubacteria bacterium]
MENLTAIDDERKENCIHCGNEWYAIHHKDGVCHSCQQKGLPGRTALERRENIQAKVAWAVGIGALLFLLGMSLAGKLPAIG